MNEGTTEGKRTVGSGGTVIKEPYEFPGGRRFHFLDPFGYQLAVWTDK